jgi:GNAT superfamily N-acetyltransferase
MLQIVEATDAHLPEINRIAHATWPATFGDILSEQQIAYMLEWMYSIDSLSDQIHHKGHVFFLVKDTEEYLGYISYELNYKGLPQTKIHKIYLLPQSQGRGAGAALINHVATVATQYQNTSLTLNVNRFNKAVGFYERIGFSVTGQEDIDIGDGFLMQDYVMTRVLNPPA